MPGVSITKKPPKRNAKARLMFHQLFASNLQNEHLEFPY